MPSPTPRGDVATPRAQCVVIAPQHEPIHHSSPHAPAHPGGLAPLAQRSPAHRDRDSRRRSARTSGTPGAGGQESVLGQHGRSCIQRVRGGRQRRCAATQPDRRSPPRAEARARSATPIVGQSPVPAATSARGALMDETRPAGTSGSSPQRQGVGRSDLPRVGLGALRWPLLTRARAAIPIDAGCDLPKVLGEMSQRAIGLFGNTVPRANRVS